MVQQPAQPRLPFDSPDLLGDRGWFMRSDRYGRVIHRQRPVLLALVRANMIIELHVGLHDVVEVPQPEADEGVEALALEGADPRLGVAVGDRGLERGEVVHNRVRGEAAASRPRSKISGTARICLRFMRLSDDNG